MKSKLLALAPIPLLLLSAAAHADLLLDDTVLNSNGGVVSATHFTSQLSYSYALANAVTVGPGGWTINSIATYFGTLGNPIPSTTTAELFIASFNGTYSSLDPLAPTNYSTVPVTFTKVVYTDPVAGFTRTTNRMSAANVDIDLAAGTYWIGLTPEISNSSVGTLMAWGSRTALAAPAAVYTGDTGAWGPPYAFWTGPSEMMQIEGSVAAVPEPASAALMALGAVGLLVARRWPCGAPASKPEVVGRSSTD